MIAWALMALLCAGPFCAVAEVERHAGFVACTEAAATYPTGRDGAVRVWCAAVEGGRARRG